MTAAADPPSAATAPPSVWSIASKMVGGALRSTPAKVIGAVIAALVLLGAVLSGIANGIGGFFGTLLVALFVLGVVGFIVAVPVFVVVLFIASSRARSAESSAMQQYALTRRLTYSPSGTLLEATPLLSAGTSRQTQDVMTGLLPGGLQGTLAHYTYYVRHHTQQGSHRVPYPNTVVIAQIPESTAYVTKLLCHDGRRIGGANIFGLDLSGDAEVELESTALNERYSIRTAAGQDQAWLRELFTPVFIDWLAAKAAAEFSFELVNGLLCVSIAGRLDRADQLDWLCGAATYVAGRIRGEVTE
ncbi:MAG TPA: hypothetical protein VEK39_01165 [Solirubrobacterales bacterium]|nr:hypothetical protein [Solirubrobacterales bacterium]